MSAIIFVAATPCRISADDNTAIARAIHKVSAEYGLTADKGHTAANPNLDKLFQVHSQLGAAHQVAEQNGEVVGGDGVVPLGCSELGICELQKMYFLSSVRGQGLAKELTLMALEHVRGQGFKQHYLETTAFLTETTHLYEHLGSEYISEALGRARYVNYGARMLKPL